jgi:hypothetical protein
MLYDPKWEAKTTDPFTLESLIAWLEKQAGPERAGIGCGPITRPSQNAPVPEW